MRSLTKVLPVKVDGVAAVGAVLMLAERALRLKAAGGPEG
jgi:hypothetical protein